MKKIFVLLLLVALNYSIYSNPIKVACVGNSITAGAGIPNNFQNSYPGILMQMLGSGYDVRNFGISGTATLSKSDYPYITTSAYKDALAFLPDIVTIKLGTNDSKSFNWVYGSEFEKDLTALVKSFQNLSSNPKIYLCLPAKVFQYSSPAINDSIIQAAIIPSIRKVAKKMKITVIDLHEATTPYSQCFPDKIHPNAEGSSYIASILYKNITGKEYGEFDVTRPFPGDKSSWNEFDRYTFYYFGKTANVLTPTKATSGKPWVLTSSDSFSDIDLQLLKKGYHIVSYKGNNLNEILRSRYHFSEKFILESDDINFINSNASNAFAVYYTGRENLKKLQVPVISLNRCDNILETLSGKENTEAVVDFLVRYKPGYEKYQKINYRGTLQNAFSKFTKDKKGCVAFFGGSITEMNGWKNMIEEDLKQRFPDCTFSFIEAGISSLGSIPHSFRMEKDILENGTPDLMFIEAAVNDDTNNFSEYVRQTRAMEGIVRHALDVNQYMDIVMLHFVYDPFIDMYKEGRQPDVIMNHERVANWYGITSINLSDEICHRIKDKEFTWEEFGGTHPNWFGHKFYVAAINKVFDTDMDKTDSLPVEHNIPDKMLDKFSYKAGSCVNPDKAEKLNGFTMVNSWNQPEKGSGTRKQYVNVPMLVGSGNGASLEFSFEGSAVGIYGTFGPKSCILEYSVDGGPYKKLNTFTNWSSGLYIPWVFVLEDELPNGPHRLSLKIAGKEKDVCMIYKFVVSH